MKKKIFGIVLLFAFLIPCLTIFSACGKIESLNNKTLIFSKVQVEGSITKDEYEKEYKAYSFKFSEEEVVFSDGVSSQTYSYKLVGSKIFIKDVEDEEFPEDAYAEISGKSMVVSQTLDNGKLKVYFKAK